MDFHQIKSIIDRHDKIFISSHINPDGDSLGSAYAMYKYLDSIGKDCIIVNHSPIPEVYNFLNEDNIFQLYPIIKKKIIKNQDIKIVNISSYEIKRSNLSDKIWNKYQKYIIF